MKASQWWIANGPGHLLSSTTRGQWHHCVARVDVYPSLLTDYKKNIKNNQKKWTCVHVKARAVNIWCASYHWPTLVVYAVPCYWFPQLGLGSSKLNPEHSIFVASLSHVCRLAMIDGYLLSCTLQDSELPNYPFQKNPLVESNRGTHVRPHCLFWWWFCDGRLLGCASHAGREWL